MKRLFTRFSLVLSVVLLLCNWSGATFAAATCPSGMSDLDCASLYGGWTGWVPDNGSSSCGATNLVGGDNETKIWNYFIAKGLSPAQTAGLEGNLQSESAGTFNPSIVQGGGTSDTVPNDGVTGYGLGQWTSPGRKANLIAFAQQENLPVNDLGLQLDFIWHELSTSYQASTLTPLKAISGNDNTAADQAAVLVMINYEAPLDHAPDGPNAHARSSNAENILGKYGSSTSTSGSSTSTSVGCSSTDCTSAVGSAKILCAAQRYKGIWYQFGGAHAGRDAFVSGCPDPSNPPNNQASGKIGSDGSNGNPSPCAVDCSGLVSMAVDDAFDQKFDWAVADITQDSSNWKKLNTGSTTFKQALSNAQPGDVVTEGTEHVVIFMSLSGNTITDFEASETGTQVGQMTHDVNTSGMDGVYQYIGPGSS